MPRAISRPRARPSRESSLRRSAVSFSPLGGPQRHRAADRPRPAVGHRHLRHDADAPGTRPISWRAICRKISPPPSTPTISPIRSRGRPSLPGGERDSVPHHQLVLRQHDHVADVERDVEQRNDLRQARAERIAGVGLGGLRDEVLEDAGAKARQLACECDPLIRRDDVEDAGGDGVHATRIEPIDGDARHVSLRADLARTLPALEGHGDQADASVDPCLPRGPSSRSTARARARRVTRSRSGPSTKEPFPTPSRASAASTDVSHGVGSGWSSARRTASVVGVCRGFAHHEDPDRRLRFPADRVEVDFLQDAPDAGEREGVGHGSIVEEVRVANDEWALNAASPNRHRQIAKSANRQIAKWPKCQMPCDSLYRLSSRSHHPCTWHVFPAAATPRPGRRSRSWNDCLACSAAPTSISSATISSASPAAATRPASWNSSSPTPWRKGADTLITCGAVQSNHCRLTLAAAVKEGLKCRLVLEERVANSYNPDASGNNFLFRLLGVEAVTVVKTGVDLARGDAEGGGRGGRARAQGVHHPGRRLEPSRRTRLRVLRRGDPRPDVRSRQFASITSSARAAAPAPMRDCSPASSATTLTSRSPASTCGGRARSRSRTSTSWRRKSRACSTSRAACRATPSRRSATGWAPATRCPRRRWWRR